jgi:hypothetical protein
LASLQLAIFAQAMMVEGHGIADLLEAEVNAQVGPVQAARAEALDMEDLGDGGVLETGEFNKGQVQLLVTKLQPETMLANARDFGVGKSNTAHAAAPAATK